jgi:hypothetical protein
MVELAAMPVVAAVVVAVTPAVVGAEEVAVVRDARNVHLALSNRTPVREVAIRYINLKKARSNRAFFR